MNLIKGKARNQTILKKFQNNISKDKIIVYLFILAILYSSIGYHLGTDDHVEHFVSLFRIMDPDYLSNDYFVNANSGFGPRFYYSHLIVLLSHIAPITIIFFVLTFFSNFVIILVTYGFCKKLIRKSTIFCLLIPGFMMLFLKFNIGGSGNIWDTYLTPTSLSLSFILLGIYELFIKSNRLLANIFLTLSTLIHPMLGFYGWIVSFGSLFVYNALYNKKMNAGNILSTILVPIILVIFWFIPKHILMKGSIPLQDFINIYAYFRLPHHIIPSQFPLLSYIKYVILFLSLAGLIKINSKYKLINDKHIDVQLFHLSLISIIILNIFCIIGFIFTEIIPIKIFIIMQPFKSNSLFNWYLLILIISLSVVLRRTNIKNKNLLFISILILLVLVSLPYSGRYVLFPFILIIPFIYIFYLKKRFVSIFLPIVFIFVFLIFFLGSKNSLADKMRKMFHTSPIFSQSYNTEQYGIADDKERLEVINYVINNTNIDDTFLTPPGWGDFRYRAKRAIVIAFKIGSFKEAYMKDWKERIDDFYGPVPLKGKYLEKLKIMQKNYTNITLDNLEILSKKYHFNYVILPVDSWVNNNIIFQNNKFKILEIIYDSIR